MATSWQIEQPTKGAFTYAFFDNSCDITYLDATVTMDDTSDLKVGMYVRGIYAPFEYGTDTGVFIYKVASITNSTTFELNQVIIVGTQSNVTLEFFHLGSFSPDNVTGKANSNDDFTLNVNTLSANLSSGVKCSVDASESEAYLVGSLLNDIIEVGDSLKIFSSFDILNNNTFEITGQLGSSISIFSITAEEDVDFHDIVYELNPTTQSWGFDGKISSGTTWGFDGTIATGTSWGFDGTIT